MVYNERREQQNIKYEDLNNEISERDRRTTRLANEIGEKQSSSNHREQKIKQSHNQSKPEKCNTKNKN